MVLLRYRRWAIPTAFAVALTGAALYCRWEAAAKWAVIRGWLDARPGLTRVDLSRPGSTTVSFLQPIETHHHGQFFYLDFGPDVSVGTNELKGLKGSVRFTDEAGVEVERFTFHEGIKAEAGNPSRFLLGPSVALSKGRYQMTVDVETGAPGLAGLDQSVYSRLRVCGLEELPAIFWQFLSLVVAVPAGIAWLVVIVRVAKYRYCSQTGNA